MIHQQSLLWRFHAFSTYHGLYNKKVPSGEFSASHHLLFQKKPWLWWPKSSESPMWWWPQASVLHSAISSSGFGSANPNPNQPGRLLFGQLQGKTFVSFEEKTLLQCPQNGKHFSRYVLTTPSMFFWYERHLSARAYSAKIALRKVKTKSSTSRVQTASANDAN